jgi:transglutaminase-like putative cysteine protease
VDDTALSGNTDETEYAAIQNQSVYFRGVSLQNYNRGRWSGDDSKTYPNYFNISSSQPDGNTPLIPTIPMFQDVVTFPIDRMITRNRLPAAVPLPQERAAFRFQPDTQLVYVHCEYLSNAQETFFAVWPYFFAESRAGTRVAFHQDRIVRARSNFPRRNVALHFMTYSFRNGNQLDLIPCQEPVDLPSLLAFNEEALPTVGKTAQEWNAELRDRGMIARARNLEHRLLTDERYYYALGGIARKASLDPLEDFVRDQPGGHCEYFAGALAMMLRKVGIPSRVMVGYRLDVEAGHIGQQRYVVRQSDAHAWVEAYIPPHEIPESRRNGPYAEWWGRGGWLRLDPTAPLRDVMAQTGPWTSWKFWATSFWNDYVINFNASRQESSLYIPISEFFISLKDRFFDVNYWKTIGRDVFRRYAEIFRSLRQGEWHGSELVLLGIPPLILLMLVYVIYRVIRRVVREVRNRKFIREQRRKLTTVEFYQRFEKILQNIGLTRTPTETQREFAKRSTADLATINGSPGEGLPIQIAEAFYRVRYGDVTLTPTEADEINTILSRLENTANCGQVSASAPPDGKISSGLPF